MMILPVLNEIALELVNEVYPAYSNIHTEVYVRIRDLPVEDKLRDLRQIHLNALIKFRGVVVKRTGVYPEEQKVSYRCGNCGDVRPPIYKNPLINERMLLGSCILCQRNFWVKDEAHTTYRNH